ncbi:proteasome activator pa28, REG alpha/beta subunit [Phanerochaete sordida]|uniref:Proteasome activator pa28, REG alpha/beta subunit n=1 Tax=Phanerochaete sordida TaxID=48140 RepID=A0A9P3L9X7_9APHY|nr:proteasome activator pa28, REG alpha/beta subunit [Phanerochaete sordida]
MSSRDIQMDKELKKQLDDFHEKTAAVAQDILFNKFPRKVLQLQELITSTSESSSPFHVSNLSTDTTVYPSPATTSDEPESKKRKLTDGAHNGRTSYDGTGASHTHEGARFTNQMIANPHIQKVHNILKVECEELADCIDKVKLWINLSMPKIEDGDNFGVQIQEEVLNELHRSQESAYNLRDAARQSHFNRAKLCSKMIKYPHIEDYALALKEHDQKQLYVAKQNLYDIRNVYAILTDILHKNIGKLRSPKGNNATGMY